METLTCPQCHTEIPEVNLNPQADHAFCPNPMCKTAFKYGKHKGYHEKGKLDKPASVEVEEFPDRLHIVIHKPLEEQNSDMVWLILFIIWFVIGRSLLGFLMALIGLWPLSVPQSVAFHAASFLLFVVLPGSLLMRDGTKFDNVTLYRDENWIQAVYLHYRFTIEEKKYTVMVANDLEAKPLLTDITAEEAFYLVPVIKDYLGLTLKP